MREVYIFGVDEILQSLEGFEWDDGNREKNRLKHKVTNKECEELFFNEPLIVLEDHKHSQEEQRYAAYGVTNDKRRLMVYFTVRKTECRVISARDMHRKERRFYEDQA